MFVIDENPTFSATCTAMVPTKGGHERQTFKATFNLVSDEHIEQLNLSSVTDTKAFLRLAVVGLDDIAGADKQPVPYSDAVLEYVISKPWGRFALSRGYFGAIAKAAEGN